MQRNTNLNLEETIALREIAAGEHCLRQAQIAIDAARSADAAEKAALEYIRLVRRVRTHQRDMRAVLKDIGRPLSVRPVNPAPAVQAAFSSPRRAPS